MTQQIWIIRSVHIPWRRDFLFSYQPCRFYYSSRDIDQTKRNDSLTSATKSLPRPDKPSLPEHWTIQIKGTKDGNRQLSR